jgi:hypothetical protein
MINLTSILSEIKIVPAGAAGGLFPGDLTSVAFSPNFGYNDDLNKIILKITTIDKVKELPKTYRIWRNTLPVYFYPETKTYEIGEIKPTIDSKGELFHKDYIYFEKDINNLSGLSLDHTKKSWRSFMFKENKVDLKVLRDIVDAFYNQYYNSSDSIDRLVKSSKEKIFKKAYEELKKTEDSYVNVKNKIGEYNLDWIEPIALDLIQKYTNADMSTYKKS